MLVSDAIPRQIDTTKSFGVAAEEIVAASCDQLLTDHPELALPRGELEADTARLLESLSIAVGVNDDAPFITHVRWLVAVYRARNVPRHLVEDELLQLRRQLRQFMPRPLAHRVAQIIDTTVLDLQTYSEEEPYHVGETLIALTADRLAAALLRGDRDDAIAVIEDGIHSGLKVLDCYVGVVQPTMYRIGKMWQDGEISVSQEHVASALIQSVMAHCRTHFRGTPANRGTLVLTGAQGELHELGLRVVGDVAEADGWEILYLGTNVPTADTLGYLREVAAQVIGISVTMPFNLAAATELAEGIRSDPVIRKASVFAGGQAAAFNSEAWSRLGVICEPEVDAERFVSIMRAAGL